MRLLLTCRDRMVVRLAARLSGTSVAPFAPLAPFAALAAAITGAVLIAGALALATLATLATLAIGHAMSNPRAIAQMRIYYVTVDGSDAVGDGSLEHPWSSLSHAGRVVPDEFSTVVVGDGTYAAPVIIDRTFATHGGFRAENPYRSRLVAAGEPVVTLTGGGNYDFVGFEVTRPGPSAAGAPLVVVAGKPGAPLRQVQIRGAIVHDSYTSDLLAVGPFVQQLGVEDNLFYNQGGFDSHIDAGGVDGLSIRGNIFFNDLAGTGRWPGGEASFVVIRDADGAAAPDQAPGNRDIHVDRNIFLGWQGAPSGYFARIGTGGGPEQRTESVWVDSNLFIGDAAMPMRAALGIEGARDVAIRANTVVGGLAAGAYAVHLARSPTGPPTERVRLDNNIWSDPTGLMTRFADGSAEDARAVSLHNNLYWNGGLPIPDVGGPSPAADGAAIVGDPLLPSPDDVVLPHWDAEAQRFAGGHDGLRAAFETLAEQARTAVGSPAIDRADGEHMPLLDLLGRPRGAPDVGALEHRPPAVPSATAPPPSGRGYLPLLHRNSTP